VSLQERRWPCDATASTLIFYPPTIPFHVYTFYPINWEFTGVLGVVLYHNILVGMWVSQHRVVLADSPTYCAWLWRFRAKPESLCLAGRKQESFRAGRFLAGAPRANDATGGAAAGPGAARVERLHARALRGASRNRLPGPEL
jgi:hypothetical protein